MDFLVFLIQYKHYNFEPSSEPEGFCPENTTHYKLQPNFTSKSVFLASDLLCKFVAQLFYPILLGEETWAMGSLLLVCVPPWIIEYVIEMEIYFFSNKLRLQAEKVLWCTGCHSFLRWQFRILWELIWWEVNFSQKQELFQGWNFSYFL